MNIVSLIGRLTKNPELKFGQKGTAYTKFSLAVDRAFQKGETDFINCSAFGKIAELIGEYLKKGSKIAVLGSLQMNRYEANGEKRVVYEVIVNNIEFLDSKGEGTTTNEGHQKPVETQKPSAPQKQVQESNGFDEEDFPF